MGESYPVFLYFVNPINPHSLALSLQSYLSYKMKSAIQWSRLKYKMMKPFPGTMIRYQWSSTLRIVLKIGDGIFFEKYGKADLKEILNDRPIEIAGIHGYILYTISGDFVSWNSGKNFWFSISSSLIFFSASHELIGFFGNVSFIAEFITIVRCFRMNVALYSL